MQRTKTTGQSGRDGCVNDKTMFITRTMPVITQQKITPTRQPEKYFCLRDFIRCFEDCVNGGRRL